MEYDITVTASGLPGLNFYVLEITAPSQLSSNDNCSNNSGIHMQARVLASPEYEFPLTIWPCEAGTWTIEALLLEYVNGVENELDAFTHTVTVREPRSPAISTCADRRGCHFCGQDDRETGLGFQERD